MRTISQRELHDNTAEILRAVSAGEMVDVTDDGKVVAVLVPPGLGVYDRLVAAGKVRVPLAGGPVDLRAVPRAAGPDSSSDIVSDVRGDL